MPPKIIGQPDIGDWTLTVNIHCTCGKVFQWSGKPGNNGPGTLAMCDSCKKVVTFTGLPYWEAGLIRWPCAFKAFSAVDA